MVFSLTMTNICVLPTFAYQTVSALSDLCYPRLFPC